LGLEMPLVRIDLGDGYSYGRARQIADSIHTSIVEVLGIPPKDRFQILNRLPAGSIIAEDAGLGFDRSNGVVMIQIFTQRGRSTEVKQALYDTIAHGLAGLGVGGADVFIGYQENGPDDWSFGFGRAQYLTGELEIPSKA
jgi:phenylpyruvate tautomerase PptA (4-oxalocrotonate tautomerase family)